MNPRFKKVLSMDIQPPSTPPDYEVTVRGETHIVPGHIKRATYRTRRYAGWTHEEAVNTPIGAHAPAAALVELKLPGSRPPRKFIGHALRGWHAKRGKETPDQLAAMKKYGVR